MDNLKQKIWSLSDNLEVDVIKDLFWEINEIENEEDRLELYSIFVARVKDLFKSWNLSESDLYGNIMEIRDDLRTYGALSEEQIDELFRVNAFNVGDIPFVADEVEEVEEKDLEISKINARIGELEAILTGVDSMDLLYEEIEKLEKAKSDETKNLNEQIKLLIAEIENREVSVTEDELNERINKLKEEQDELWRRASVSGEGLSEKDEARYHELNDLINKTEKELENRSLYSSKSVADLEGELQKYKAEQDELWRQASVSGEGLSEKDEARYHELNDLIKFVNSEIVRRQVTKFDSKSNEELELDVQKYKAEQDELWRRASVSGEGLSEKDEARYHELNGLIKELEVELEKRKNNRFIRKSVAELEAEIQKYKAEQDELWRRSSVSGEGLSEKDEARYHELNDLIKALETELEKRKSNGFDRKSKADLEKELQELLKKQKEIQSKYDKEIADKQSKLDSFIELQELRVLRDVYCRIQSEAIKNFEKEKLSQEDLRAAVEKFVNEHNLAPELDKYHEAAKLKEQLIDQVCKNLKTKKVDKKENKKKALLKGLAAAAGFAAGFALHSVPGVGTILTVSWVTKLAKMGIKKGTNFITKKFPESKVTGIINGISNKTKEFGNKFKEKHPKIAAGVEKVKKVLASEYTKSAFKGFTVGYLVGNLVDLASVKADTNTPEPEIPEQEIREPELPDPGPQEPQIETVESFEPKIGDQFDLSGVEQGYTYAGSDTPVDLMNELAGTERSVLEKLVNASDGEQWGHFLRENGNYAWQPIEDVADLVIKGKGR